MTPGRAIASFLQAFAVLVFFAIGLLWICLPYLPEARFLIAHTLLHNFEICIPIGLSFLIGAFVLGLGFYGVQRGRYLFVQRAAIGRKVLFETLERALREHLVDALFLEEIEVRQGKKLEIAVKMGKVEKGKEEEILAKAHQHIRSLLEKRFGFTSPFLLTVRSTRKGSLSLSE